MVIAYGTAGMGKDVDFDAGQAIQVYATHLASAGFLVLIPNYFERTNTPAGSQTVFPVISQHRDAWVETLGDCMTYAASRSDVEKANIGLLGFSLGGHLALRLAMLSSGVPAAAVVEFYAPITMAPLDGLGGNLARLPPTQIHHGTADTLVPIEQSRALAEALEKAGKAAGNDYEKYEYDGEPHGFRGTAAIDLSKKRTSGFFQKHRT